MVAVTGFDEQYTVDNLNRLRDMKRGTLNGSHVIPGTPPRQLAWTLDPTGNWTAYSERTSGSTTLLQTRTASEVNEITGITSYITPFWATPSYDDAGNMTSFPRASSPAGSFTATYDAWNRLMSVKQGANFVAAYAYDGLRRRVVKKSYTGGVLTETRDFYFSDQWQILSEAVGGTTDTTYVWGLRYVDELLWRVQSSTRLYAMQDANFNCTAICNTSGSVVERYQFNPYGTRTVLDAAWSVIGASAYNWVVAHQGLMIENDVGLYNCRYRVYSPLLGMWLQRDSLGYVDGFNLYEYVSGNPLARTDPEGTGWWCKLKCAAAAAIASATLGACFLAIGACVATGGAACPLALASCCAAAGALDLAISACVPCGLAAVPRGWSEIGSVILLLCSGGGLISIVRRLWALLPLAGSVAATNGHVQIGEIATPCRIGY